MRGLAELDEHGYVLTDGRQKTNIDGLYAAGDICVKSLRQVVTAVGEGALAATNWSIMQQPCKKEDRDCSTAAYF